MVRHGDEVELIIRCTGNLPAGRLTITPGAITTSTTSLPGGSFKDNLSWQGYSGGFVTPGVDKELSGGGETEMVVWFACDDWVSRFGWVGCVD